MGALDSYQDLLTRYLGNDGGVRYQAWSESEADVAALQSLLDTWLQKSPESHPHVFASASHRLSYWLNLYNALVIREILRRWPLESVKDVRPTLLSKVVPLRGFFMDLRFEVGGRSMNLAAIEHEVIRAQFKDARIHFALNCGSAACPVLRRSVFDGETLEDQLNEASRSFIAKVENVRVDAVSKSVWLSKIFRWYKSDFERHASLETGKPRTSVLDFVALFAGSELRAALEVAQVEGYGLRFADYDWSVNRSAR